MHLVQVLVFASLFLVYVIMQTFAIPGTLSLSVMAGALYGIFRGLLLVSGLFTATTTMFPINTCESDYEFPL